MNLDIEQRDMTAVRRMRLDGGAAGGARREGDDGGRLWRRAGLDAVAVQMQDGVAVAGDAQLDRFALAEAKHRRAARRGGQIRAARPTVGQDDVDLPDGGVTRPIARAQARLPATYKQPAKCGIASGIAGVE